MTLRQESQPILLVAPGLSDSGTGTIQAGNAPS